MTNRMRKAFTTLWITASVLMLHVAHGQDLKSLNSSSYKTLKKAAPGTATSLLKDARKLKDKSPGEALDKVQDALALSIAQEDTYSEAKCYVLLGEINEGIQEWKLALTNYEVAFMKLDGKYADNPEYLTTLKGLGNANLKLLNFETALQYFNQALALKLNRQDNNDILLEVSEAYYGLSNYTEALAALDKIEVPVGKIADPALEATIQSQRAKIYAKTNKRELSYSNISSAAGNLDDAKGIATPKQQQSFNDNKEAVSNTLRQEQRYDEDIVLRNKSIEVNSKLNNLEEVAKDKVEISKTFEVLGENDAALKSLEEAAHIADTLNNPKAQAKAYLALADFYEKNGKGTQALSAYKKYSNAVTTSQHRDEIELAEKNDLLKKQKDIESVSKDVSISQQQERIQEATVFRQQLIIYGLIAIIFIIATTSYFIYKNALASKTANQLLALKSLRSQMNPHFIFNALNSVNHFIAQQDERTANKFLSEFSQLMRLVLENSQEDFIPLHKEQEILSLYLKLEHYRFRDKFDYTFDVDESINTEAVEIPPMLIQPYIENAVWHGLRYKDSKGNLQVRFRQEGNQLVADIQDNGIGRKKSAAIKTENQKKHNSTGLKNIEERLRIINKVYKAKYSVMIEDLADDAGTHVKIFLPLNNKSKPKP